MAYVLSLRPQSPLKRSFSDNPYLRPCSPLGDAPISALCDITPRNGSACSLYSLGSSKAGEWLRGTENTPPLTSRSLLNLGQHKDAYGNIRTIDHAPRKRNCGISRPPPSFSHAGVLAESCTKRGRKIEPVTETSSCSQAPAECMVADADEDEDEETAEFFDLYDAIHVPLPEGRFSDSTTDEPDSEPMPNNINPQPFRRWMSTLRRRHVQRIKDTLTSAPRWSVDMVENDAAMHPPLLLPGCLRQRSGSFSSSLAYVTAIKSASITVASTSIAPRSDAGGPHGKPRMGNRSSGFSDARRSTDSNTGALGPIIDESAWLRSLQRRKIVEELISSEESYIADLKVLVNVRCPNLLSGVC